MGIFAISDLHLSKANPKPMDIFGANWENHWDKIKNDWCMNVQESDTVLIPGDISWAITLDDAMADIMDIDRLPGRKVLSRGNHDYWWSSASKMKKVFPESICFVQNNFVDIGDWYVSGTRGWNLPGDERFTDEDMKIYKRELMRLELSLSSAPDTKPIIVMIHYPPFYENGEPSKFVDIMKKYNVKHCVFGHLHGDSLKRVIEGEMYGIRFTMVSCDYLDFKVKKIY